jgi:hypothetical protein
MKDAVYSVSSKHNPHPISSNHTNADSNEEMIMDRDFFIRVHYKG